MRSIIFSCLVLACSIVFTTSKSVALPVDFIDNGNYTTDTLSGLDWLDVTETVGLSYNSVSAQFGNGGTYEGWRYATSDEVAQLVSNWIGENISILYTDHVSPDNPQDNLKGLIDLLNPLYSSNDNVSINGLVEDTFELDPDIFRLILVLDYNMQDNVAHYQSAFFVDYVSDNSDDNGFGSFLIRNTQISVVPLPPTLWVFGAALGGIGWLTRKKKTA